MQSNETDINQKPRNRRTREEIKILIERWKATKISRSEFCRREGLCIQTFCHWVKQIEVKAKPQTTSPLSFLPIQTSGHHQNSEAHTIEIKLPNGLQCRFSMNSDIKHITQITKELINVISY